MIETKIVSGSHNIGASVTRRGQLVTAPLSYSEFYTNTAIATATAYNLVPPKTGKKFVITDIILAADRDWETLTILVSII